MFVNCGDLCLIICSISVSELLVVLFDVLFRGRIFLRFIDFFKRKIIFIDINYFYF